MRVLVVEDDVITRDTLREILERDGYVVTAVENAIAGFAELQHTEYAAVICDYRLPFMGGESFYEEVLTDSPDAAGTFVFVTGYAHDPQVQAKLSATGQPVLPKPFDHKDLLRAVQDVARGTQADGA